MQAIETKYIGPTNYRGSRIKASCERGSISISYDETGQAHYNLTGAEFERRRNRKWPDSEYEYEQSGETLTNHTYDRETMAYLPNKAKPYALQVCNAGAMPESFEEWLKANGDDIGGNWTPDKLAANHDQYDNERHPFA